MKHSKVFKRDDGTRLKIKISFRIEGFDRVPVYSVLVEKCLPGKRKFIDVVDTDDWDYRKLAMESRPQWRKEQQLKYVTEEEVLVAKTELWQLLHPSKSSEE